MNEWGKWEKWRKWGRPQAPAAEPTLYWVGWGDDDWATDVNWSFTSGGPPGGPGIIPTADWHVVIEPGLNSCTIPDIAACKSLTIRAGGVLNFLIFAFEIFGDCIINSEEAMTWDGTTQVWGDIYINAAADITYQPSFSWLIHPKIGSGDPSNFTDLVGDTLALSVYDQAVIVAGNLFGRLKLINGAACIVGDGLTIVLGVYQNFDWDGGLLGGNATWYLDNSAVGAMTVRDMVVKDSEATNAIDATDNCLDLGGNVNWNFV